MPDHGITRLEPIIKSEARRLGFDLVGITSPDPPPHLEVYQKWLDDNRHGEMHYLASKRGRERRRDPRLILPECLSILVLGANCLPASLSEAPGGGELRVAAYALGMDYHDVLVERLALLMRFLEDRLAAPIPHRICCDTAPVLERELAQRAGLGWIGKNTCLINPKRGSYFLLAEVLLGIQLEPDPPFAFDHCGSCSRCIQACPTNCILPDRTLDARRCISYLTIESRGLIPEPLRPQIGDWLFGCDICQAVCPWNLRFAQATQDQAFTPRPILHPPELLTFLTLSTTTYQEQLRHSPLKRAKRPGLVRNAVVVAGNRGEPELAPVLEHLLREDADPLVRAHAAWALACSSLKAAGAALPHALQVEQTGIVREAIQFALESLGKR